MFYLYIYKLFQYVLIYKEILLLLLLFKLFFEILNTNKKSFSIKISLYDLSSINYKY